MEGIKMNKDEFDRLFDDSFDKISDNTQDEYSSDYRPSWKKVKGKISAEKKKHTRKTFFRNVSVVAVSMLLGALIFGATPATKAFNPFYQSIKEFPGQITTLFFGNQDRSDNHAKTSQPINETQQNQDLDLDIDAPTVLSVTLEEAKEQANFEIPSFSYIPAGYELKKTDLFINGIPEKVRFTFTNQDDLLLVTLTVLGEDAIITSGSRGAKVEEVQLIHGKGYLTVTTDGSSKIEFLKRNIHILILGELQEDELIRLAENM